VCCPQIALCKPVSTVKIKGGIDNEIAGTYMFRCLCADVAQVVLLPSSGICRVLLNLPRSPTNNMNDRGAQQRVP